MTHTSTEQPELLQKAGAIAFRLSRSGDKQAAASIRTLLARVQELEDLNKQLCEQQEALSNAYAAINGKYRPVCYRATLLDGITQEKQG